MSKIQQSDILAMECKHAVYCRPPKGESDDYHLVKELIHLKDGRKVPNVRMIKNFKRDFYITKEGARVHKQKKEREFLTKLLRFESTESRLVRTAANALGKPWFKGSIRDLSESPYLYGTDIVSTSLVKNKYQKKWPEAVTPYSVACFDTETYMSDGSIIMTTTSMKNKVFTAIRKDFFTGHANVENRLREAFEKYLGELAAKRNIDWEFKLVDTELDVIIENSKKWHSWQPDFLAAWNMKYDIGKVREACTRAGYPECDIFSDPKVPVSYRFFRFKEGEMIKKMASGKESPISPADQWHVVECPASFYVIDPMCVYRRLRLAKGELPSYSLDYILGHELGERKLRFTETDQYIGAEWHEVMQAEHPVEYVIYNLFDCIGMEMLDEKTNDLALALPGACQYSDFANFKSQPKRIADALHYYLLENEESVIGSTNSSMVDELDKLLPRNADLIVNLKAYLLDAKGLEFDGIPSRYYINNYDSDVAGAYPSNTIVFNISRETNTRILCRIEGKSEREMRHTGFNLSGGHTNSVELATSMFGLPIMDELLAKYKAA